ncbi:MAG: signal peptidase II [Acidobacteria bacterium]|nr:signal peptidase II [Acidobacteriota bacterium]
MRGFRPAWLLLPLGVFLADAGSKAWVLRHFTEREVLPVIPGFFNITLGFNPGAIFGSLQGAHPGLRGLIFTVAGLVALGYFGWEFTRPQTPSLQRWALGLILGGILGNGADRLAHGAVVDFLDFIFWGWHYWTFNLADSAIVCGAILMGLGLVKAARSASEAHGGAGK